MLSNTTAFFNWLIGGDTPQAPLQLHQVAARAVIVYVVGVLIVRIGKSRLLSRVTALDVILGFILGSLLSRGITGNASMSGTAVASAALVFVHWGLTALAFRWHWFGTVFKGRSRILISDGKLQREAMRASNISENDILSELRLRGVERVEDVSVAYKERNGEVSAIERKPTPRVVDVKVQDGVQLVRIELS